MKNIGAQILACGLTLLISTQAWSQTAMDVMGAAGVNSALEGSAASPVNGARAREMTRKATRENDNDYDSRSRDDSKDRNDRDRSYNDNRDSRKPSSNKDDGLW